MANIPIIGKVTVGGTAKDITGGYVNIGGVWKPIVKTYVNVNGVWKSAWKNLYTWKKYSVNTTTSAPYTYSEGAQISVTYASKTSVRAGSSFTFDANTGIFTLKTQISTYITSLTTSRPYFTFTSGSPSGMFKYYSKSGTTVTYAPYNVSATITQSRGDYISDVTSESESAYPTNGVHTDGYWYVRYVQQ